MEKVEGTSFIRCKKCLQVPKTRCNFCDYALYYTCIIMMETRVCTELRLKSY